MSRLSDLQKIDYTRDLEAVARIDAVQTILQVVCKVTGLGFAAVARVTDRRWIACAVRDEITFGVAPGGELDAATTLCNEIRATREPIIIDHVAQDTVYCGHPTPRQYGFQSYISMPIVRSDGEFFGTLCALDPKPATLRTPEVEAMFRLFADLIASQLDAQDLLARSDQALLDARRSAELREQFIAVLGHDLRSPLSAIASSAMVLQRISAEPKVTSMASLIRSSADRMSVLISDVMDFARGRLGGGLPLSALPRVQLAPVLEQVVAETRASVAERAIESYIEPNAVVSCDSGRIAQLAANLLTNAVVHGDPLLAIQVHATVAAGFFELSVSNDGPEIPEEIRARLFEPFYRASVSRTQQGLGLGLYIATEIARAHGGEIHVESHDRRTTFTFRMPVSGART